MTYINCVDGQGPPQGAPGGDFDSFWSASRTSRDQKKGVRKMDRKMDPQKNDFRRLLDRDVVNPGRVCGPHLALEFEDSVILFGTPCTPEGAADLARRAPWRGRRIPSLRALRQFPAWVSLRGWWVKGGMALATLCVQAWSWPQQRGRQVLGPLGAPGG